MAVELYLLLSNVTFNRLILLGDMFSDLNFSRLTSDHWRLISLIRWLSNPKKGIEVVWVEGNHDANLTQVMEHLIGVKVYQLYEWYWNGKKCIAMHGHQFDALYTGGNPWFNELVTEFYLMLQRVGFLQRWLPRILDHLHTKYQHLTTKVADGALNVAREQQASFVFCGHTHDAYHDSSEGIEYWNSGCWVGEIGSYLTLDDERVDLQFVKRT